MICKNCFDFDNENKVCTIRGVRLSDGTRKPMPKTENQTGCPVFMRKPANES